MTKISIIIPTKNEEQFIEGLLESIQSQKILYNHEILIADNNSIDKTIILCQKYNTKIISGGIPSVARNKGAKIATGDWLIFLDADMILKESSINSWINELEKNKLFFGTPYIELQKAEKNFLARFYYNNSKIWYRISDCIFGGCIIIKKSLFQEVGGFDENMILLEDVDFLQKLKRKTKRINLFPACETSSRRFEKIGGLKVIFISSFMFFLYKMELKKFINFFNKIYKL